MKRSVITGFGPISREINTTRDQAAELSNVSDRLKTEVNAVITAASNSTTATEFNDALFAAMSGKTVIG